MTFLLESSFAFKFSLAAAKSLLFKIVLPSIKFLYSFVKPITSIIFDKLFSKKVLKVYRESNNAFIERQSIDNNWFPLAEKIEIRLQLSTCYCESRSTISIRNKGFILFDEIKLRIEVEGYFNGIFRDEYYIMEEEITFGELGFTERHPKIRILSNIPRVEFWRTENGGLINSFQKMNIIFVSYKVDSSEIHLNKNFPMSSSVFSSLLNDLLKDNWIKRDSTFYHIGRMNEAKSNLKTQNWCLFNPPPICVRGNFKYQSPLNPPSIYTRINDYVNHELFWNQVYLMPGELLSKFICFILTRDKVVSFTFWCLILFFGFIVNDEGYLDLPHEN
jgi:hypothetical protein